MPDQQVKELVDKYISLSFSIEKVATSLIKNQLDSDLTNEQHYMLRYIYQHQSCTSSELAEVFSVKKSAITAMITRLWSKGLIKRTRDVNDRRVVYLTLTENGQELFMQTENRIHQLVASIINQFEHEEIIQFFQSYEKLQHVLNETKKTYLED